MNEVDRKQFNKKFAAMAIGNILEWFDFASFGALADVIGEEFFPADQGHNMQLLQSLSVFGAAFVMRPLGGTVMGWVGDRFGRKKALEISIAMMLVPSFIIGCLPSYHMAGWTMTAILVLLRLMQGIACGGELVGAYIFIIEATKGHNQGYWGACCKATGNFGTAIGMGLVALLRAALTQESMRLWGWRVPFLLGIVFGFVGIRLRQGLEEEEDRPHMHIVEVDRHPIVISGKSGRHSRPAAGNKPNPFVEAWRTHWREMTVVILVAAFWGCGYYSAFVWMMYFMSKNSLVGGAGSDADDDGPAAIPYAWTINFLMNFALVLVFPIGGMIGDTLGRTRNESPNREKEEQNKGFQRALILALVIAIGIALPAFALICTRTIEGAVIGQGLFVIALGLYGANLPAFMISQFDPHLRYTGMGFAYNVAHAIFSGTAPLVQTALVLSSDVPSTDVDTSKVSFDIRNDSRLRPAFYIMIVAFISLITLLIGVPYCEKLRKQKRGFTQITTCEDDHNLAVVPSAPAFSVTPGESRYDENQVITVVIAPMGAIGAR